MKQPATGGCDSFVGMKTGEQVLNLDPGCWWRSVILHEVGHALGFHHEHQRSDRDNYVTIHYENVADPDPKKNWWAHIPGGTTNWTGNDFLSIMHYSRNGGAKPGTDIIVPKPGYTQYIDEMGQQPGMSRLERMAAATAYGPPAQPPSAVVTNTQDSGRGTLRTAMYYASDRAEATPGTMTTVQFRIPTTDPGFADTVFTIKPTSGLPVGHGTIIDGATQTSFTGNTNTAGPEVVLNGSTLATTPQVSPGFLMKGVNSSVRSMVINGFPDAGISIKRPRAAGNTVLGNYIGTDRTGTVSVFNAHTGVRIDEGARGNTIGGATASARNVISGNRDYGVSIGGLGTNSNVVSGNYIGVNRTGSAALPNQFSGVVVADGARSNQIGGAVAGAGNVVSGNPNDGVAIWGAGTSGNVVRGNFLGVNAAGTARIPNAAAGVSISGGAQSNIIGGPSAPERNVVSGNGQQGVSILGAGTNSNVVRGNYIGLNAAGTGAVPNGAGVLIRLGARSNLIGGTSAGAGNVISGNNNQGVAITGAGTNSNRVEGNRIGTDAAGSVAVGNTWAGAAVSDGAQSNVIGGLVAGAGNTISGGKNHGVHLGGANTKFNLLQGNRIGSNAAGTAALANALSGVEVAGASSNTIGGIASGARNSWRATRSTASSSPLPARRAT